MRPPAARRPVPPPLAPDPVAVLHGRGDVHAQIGHVLENLGPVPPYVLPAAHRRVGVTRTLADVVLAKEPDERVEIVGIERSTHSLDDWWRHPITPQPHRTQSWSISVPH